MPFAKFGCKKYWKERSQFLIFWLWLFRNVLWLASQTSSSSSMNARMTSLDSSLSPESMQSFSFSSSLLLSLPPLSSSSLSLLSLPDKGSSSASSQFLSILFVADQFLQNSLGEASVCRVRCFSSLWCLRYSISSGTRSFFSFCRIRKNFPSIVVIIFSPSPFGFPFPSPLPSSF